MGYGIVNRYANMLSRDIRVSAMADNGDIERVPAPLPPPHSAESRACV